MKKLEQLDVTLNMDVNVKVIGAAIETTGLNTNASGKPVVQDVTTSRDVLKLIDVKIKEAEEYFWRPLDSPEIYKRLMDLAHAVGDAKMVEDYKSKIDRIEANDLEFSGRMYRFYGNNKRALEYYRKALELAPDHPLAGPDSEKAAKAVEKASGELEKAERTLDSKPDDSKAWYKRAVASMNLDMPEQAVEFFDEVLKLDPENADAWAKKGTALLSLERYDEARTPLTKALDLKPTSMTAKRGINYLRFLTGETTEVE